MPDDDDDDLFLGKVKASTGGESSREFLKFSAKLLDADVDDDDDVDNFLEVNDEEEICITVA